jgi:hypothetical protein
MNLRLLTVPVIAGCILPTAFAQSKTVDPATHTNAKAHEVALAPSSRSQHTLFVGGSDSCSSPQAISGVGTFPFDNSGATTGAEGQANAACDFFGTMGITNDVWFVWTASGTGVVSLLLCGSATIDSKVAIYAGGGCPGGAPIACNDDSCGLQSNVSFAVMGGNQYTIQLGTFPGATGGSGTFQLWTACCSPPICEPSPGSDVPCPCTSGNLAGHGCNNSDDTGGAYLSVAGISSLGSDSVVFTCSGEKASALSIVLQGDSLVDGVVFGQGILCTGGNLLRLYVEHAVGGSITAPSSGEPSVSARSAALGDVLTAGATRHHQVYYRDPIVHRPCDLASATFNTSQGQQITWYP